jgi:hypothetical protein
VKIRLAGVGLAALLVVAACGASAETATGIVLHVDGTSPSAISSFLLRTADGHVITFMVGPVTFDQQSFPPEHLREHQALAMPVTVTYQVENGQDVAVKLQDAPRS